MKKIKILQTIRQGKVGGGETHVLELCAHLDKSKYEPVVLSFTDGEMVGELQKRNIRTKVIHTETAFDRKIWKQVTAFVKEEKFDIIHAHGTRACSNSFWSAKKANLPLIYTVHGWSFHDNQNFIVKKLRHFSEAFLTAKATKTICVSVSNQDEGKRIFNLKRSQVVYNTINTEKFNPDKQYVNLRNDLGIAVDKIVVGYIVRFTVQKDPLTMVKAMRKIVEQNKNVVLLAIGEGPLKEDAVALTKELGIENNVVFQPFRRDIPEILHAIDIYCLPSLWEGLPIGVLEAMSMQKSVVATPVNGTKELIRHNETGVLVAPQSPQKLSNAILRLAKDKELRTRLATKAKDFVRNHFYMQNMVDKVQDIYEGVV